MIADKMDDIGSHLVANHSDVSQEPIPNETSTLLQSSKEEKSGISFQNVKLNDFMSNHPTAHLSRKETSEVERQNINVNVEYGREIDVYLRQLENQNLTDNSLLNHKITANLRARMVDWMIEVLTNFKCEDQTFFLAINLLDRYLKNKKEC